MNTEIESWADLIGLWPSAEELARNIGLTNKHRGQMVRNWIARDYVPAEFLLPILLSAEERGYGEVTPRLLLRLAGRHKRRVRRNAA